MINIVPPAILFSIGKISIHYYGLIMVFAILMSMFVISELAQKRNYNLKKLENLYFYVIIFGLIGARLYEVFFFHWSYYQNNLGEIIKVWHGGLAIQGSILFGILTVYFFCKKNQLIFSKYSDLLVVGLALGQSIGRWGNFFNQELYGRISNLPWAIYIEQTNSFHHPVFLYESILDLILFFLLLKLFQKKYYFGFLTLIYLIGYSLIRFFMEFLRIDSSPLVIGFRLPQLLSFLVLIGSLCFFCVKKRIMKIL